MRRYVPTRRTGRLAGAAKRGVTGSTPFACLWLSSTYVCEIRLRGFPVQTSSVPLITSAEVVPDTQNIASGFYLEESDLKALLARGCFYNPHACLEIAVFSGRKESHCGVGTKRQQIGIFKMQVGPEWCEGKSLILFNGG
ncbi:hypothetical protein SESBI_04941 [Sesbania bispinosa]|nr:hypothetical protein SESBI_04941 [Sesbania bispinosa]